MPTGKTNALADPRGKPNLRTFWTALAYTEKSEYVAHQTNLMFKFMVSLLKEIDSQVIVTSLDDLTDLQYLDLNENNHKLFHVEHGTIREAV